MSDDKAPQSQRATLFEAMQRGQIPRTTWISREPCPRCGEPLATNGTGAAWHFRRKCEYARQVKRSKG